MCGLCWNLEHLVQDERLSGSNLWGKDAISLSGSSGPNAGRGTTRVAEIVDKGVPRDTERRAWEEPGATKDRGLEEVGTVERNEGAWLKTPQVNANVRIRL